jgi:hypothetical protein
MGRQYCIPGDRQRELKAHPTSRGHTMTSDHRTIDLRSILGRLRIRRRVGSLLVAASAVLLGWATPHEAWAVSTRDLIELSKAGLGDEVLVALVEADGTVFNLDAPRILELRAAGVSESVITAMLRNASRPAPAPSGVAGADRAAAAPPPAPDDRDGAPYFVIIGEKPAAPPTPPAPTYIVPWVPSWAGTPGRPARPTRPMIEYRGFGRFINDGWIDNTRR